MAGRSEGLSILVDARGLAGSGIGRYTSEILTALLADPRFGRISLLGQLPALRDFCEAHDGADRATLLSYPYGYYSPAAHLAWLRMRAAGEARADVAFFPHYDTPLLAFPTRSVVTVHDLIHFKVPDAFSGWRRNAASVVLRRGVTRATRVITGSESTRRDLVERIPEVEDRIDLVPYGVSDVFRAGAVGARAGGGASIRPSAPYLLCVGNRKPHKNLVAAVETLGRLRDSRPELKLVFVGKSYDGWDAVLARAEELGVRDRLVEHEGVSDDQLRELYQGCEVLLFLSLYEGFGLPVVEAMGCGAPVIASNRSAIPEAVGGAGILVSPDDYDAIAAAVTKLAGEPALRRELVRKGLQRAAGFTWAAAARQTAEILHAVATAGSPRRAPEAAARA
jgi:glycosyltransferase involved in cell wall biosynthesis